VRVESATMQSVDGCFCPFPRACGKWEAGYSIRENHDFVRDFGGDHAVESGGLGFDDGGGQAFPE